MRFISQFWNGSKAIARSAGSHDLQLFDLKEKETTEAAVAFDTDFDIARAVIFNAGGEFVGRSSRRAWSSTRTLLPFLSCELIALNLLGSCCFVKIRTICLTNPGDEPKLLSRRSVDKDPGFMTARQVGIAHSWTSRLLPHSSEPESLNFSRHRFGIAALINESGIAYAIQILAWI
jgi:hypothetical protein